VNTDMLVGPLPEDEARDEPLVKGENIVSLPDLDPLPDTLSGPVLLKVGDNISTDEISPAGARALPYRSNIPKLAEFTFTRVDEDYPERAAKTDSAHLVVAGENYGQGSSREHAAITPRFLGLRMVIAKSFARIHWQNLANFGIVPLEFADASDCDRIEQGDELTVENLRDQLANGTEVTVRGKDREFRCTHRLSPRQVETVLAGGVIPRIAQQTNA
jgi:aconitate hydratase